MISVLNQRGGNHNSCEDSFFVKETDVFVFGGIFDGCSTGINSHWASTTISYIFQNISYGAIGMSINDAYVQTAMDYMEQACMLLRLSPDTNLLSTCLLFVYNKETKDLEIRCFGDGVYYVNDIEYVIDQGNIPHYIAYVLKEDEDTIKKYLDKYPSVVHKDVHKFIICSDGIQAINQSQYDESSMTWQELLLSVPKSENYLKRMWNILKINKFTLNDDLTIISYANS